MKWWCSVVLIVVQCLRTALTAKILAICAAASHSHSLWCFQYMAALAERGHQITVLGVDKPKIKIANLTTFIADEVYEITFPSDFTANLGLLDNSKIATMYPAFQVWNEYSSKSVLYSKALKDLMKQNENNENPFDLIIHDNVNADALLGLVPLFGNPPLLLATTYGSPQWMTFRAGNIFNPAYVPSMITDADQHMSFYERCLNTFYYVFLEGLTKYVAEPFQDKLMREVFGDNLPYVADIAKRANIIIVNYHFALNGPRPLLPGVIGISGLHISEPKPLPQDIKEFMDGAEQGVILFSFGSNVDSKWLQKNIETTIVEALSQVPQRILWKWDTILPNLPSNIKMSKWLPQGDMLVHPNIRLFITHCGLLSTQEALYHKVPILAIPVFLDQIDNAAFLVRQNLTIKLNVHTLTANGLRDGIKEILANKKYKKNIEKMGELMRDMPHTARQQAVFWTEYALRHKGAGHLHSAAADMPWYQLLLLDVLGCAILLLLIGFWILKRLVLFFYRRLIFSNSKNKED